MEAGTYLTDGVFLYRVAGLGAGEEDDVLELEECLLLDVVRVRESDVLTRGLRVVTPAAAPRSDGSGSGLHRSRT